MQRHRVMKQDGVCREGGGRSVCWSEGCFGSKVGVRVWAAFLAVGG